MALTSELLSKVEKKGTRNRVRTLSALDVAARRLREACVELLDERHATIRSLRSAVFKRVSRDRLAAAVDVVGALTRPEGDRYYEDLLSKYPTVRRFLPLLLDTIDFAGTTAGRPVLAALDALREIEGRKHVASRDVPLHLVRGSWQSLVLGSGGALDRRAYTFCVLEQLRDALRRPDVFVAGSERWGDPFANLLDGAAWEAARPQICRTLDHDPSPSRELSALSEALDSAYRHTAARLPENGDVRIEGVGRRASIVVTALDKLEEPSTLLELRERVAALLPRVDLPELLLEVGSWTRFTEEFTNVSEGAGRVDDLTTSVCAVLIAEACNLGIEPLNASRESRINDPPPALAAHTRPRCASRQNLHIIHHSHPALTPTDNEGWLRAAWLVSQCLARRSACR